MRKRKGQPGFYGRSRRNHEIPETLIREEKEEEGEGDEVLRARGKEEEEDENNKERRRFFACYLLTSLSPRHKGQTYIGFTVNPRRRIRQHNGEIGCGAWRTKSKRPWEMVLCIYGFPTNVAALQFEWAWQHPLESLAVRKAAAAFRSLSGLPNKIKLAFTMLTLPAWQSLNLTVNFFSTKYKMHTASCPSLPEQMKIQVCSMDELPCYAGNDYSVHEYDKWDDNDDHNEHIGAVHGGTEQYVDERMCNFSDYPTILEESTSELCVPTEKMEMRQPTECPVKNEDCGLSFCLNDSPMRVLSVFVPCSYNIEETVEDGDVLIERNGDKLDWRTMKPLTTADVHEDEPAMKSSIALSEVEVIDLFTPSPCYKGSSRSKKRAPNTIPDVIDLTKSPVYV